MKFKIKILWTTLLTTLLWPLFVLGVEVHEPQTESVTEHEDLTDFATTEAVTTSPRDNGMTLGDISDLPTSSDSLLSPSSHLVPTSSSNEDVHLPVTHFLPTAPNLLPTPGDTVPNFNDKEESGHPKPTVSPSILFDYPENHKNFTPSPYLGAIETPPVVSDYNRYQQQYKEYYAQKNQYNQKPIKFEENSAKNQYVSHGLGSYLNSENSHVKKQLEHAQPHFLRKPFPYAYEHKLAHNEYEPESVVTATGSGHVDAYASQDYQYNEDGQENNEIDPPSLEEISTNYKPPLMGFPVHDANLDFGYEHYKHVQGGDHKGGHTWKKVLRMLTALVPLGLLFATLTPSVLSINTTVDQKPSRQRSVDGAGLQLTEEDLTDPLVQLVQRYGLESLDDPQCEDKIFCEMSRMGQKDDGNFIQRGFWYLANETPDDLAQQVGMKELFKAIRTNTCDVYKCQPKEKVIEKKDEDTKLETKPTKPVKPTKRKKFQETNKM